MRDGINRANSRLFLVATAALAFWAGQLSVWAYGGGLTEVPPDYNESFEGSPIYTNGCWLVTNNVGWWSEAPDAIQIVTTNLTYGGQRPMGGSHTNILKLDSAVTNVVTTTGAVSVVYIDMLLQPRRWDEETRPAVSSDVATAVFVDSNGYMTAYCASNFATTPIRNQWVTFDQNIASGQWVRLTVEINFNVAGYDWMRFQVDNSAYLTNYEGQTFPGWYDNGGEWFAVATDTRRIDQLHSLAFSGSGFLDDLVVTTNKPPMTPPRKVRTIAGVGATIAAETGQQNPGGGIMDVAIVNGGTNNFSWYENEGYNIINQSWGVGLGSAFATNYFAATNWGVSNIDTNYTVQVFTVPETRTLNVVSANGAPSPSGTTLYDYNTMIIATMGNPTIDVAPSNQTACMGFTRTISSPDTQLSDHDVVTSTVFTIQGATSGDITDLTWNWTTRFWLQVQKSGLGSVDQVPQWCRTGVTMTIIASTNFGSMFAGWSGNTNDIGAEITNLMIHVCMTNPRLIQANFTGGAQFTSNGTPINTWIAHYYPTLGSTNAQDLDNMDLDGDGLKTWQEYIAGTDPTDFNSCFIVLSQTWLDIDGGPSNLVTFFGASDTNWSGVVLPFGMLRGSNLMDPWELISPPIPRQNTVNGTNIFWDMSPVDGVPLFYRPLATNAWTP